MAGAPNVAQIRERLRLLKERGRLPGVVAFYAPGIYTGPDSLTFDGEQVEIRRCECVLEIREALASRDGATDTAVLLTPVSYEELGADVLARLAGRKLFRADSWAAAMNRFHALRVDPRLVREGWIADLLIELPGNDFPAVPDGYLSVEVVWRTLLGRLLGMGDERPDALALLRWLAVAGKIEAYAAMDDQLRAGLRRWVEMTAGEAGAAIADCVEATRNHDAIAVGLVLDILSQPANGADSALRVCAARLERLHGNRPLSAAAARVWAQASRTLVEEQAANSEAAPGWINRADELLTEIDAAPYVALGDLSPLGFAQRAERYARALVAALSGGAIEQAEAAADALERHRQSRLDRTGYRVAMARRLLRWLAAGPAASPARSLGDAVLNYVNCGAWIDRTRMALRGGDPQASLSRAYEALLERARAEREKENERFGALLVEWNAGAPRNEAIMPIEEVTERVVGPIAEHAPLLLLVLDGVSLPIFYEFLDNLKKRNWTILGRKGSGKKELPITPAIAAIPSITEVSRASLLAGKLVRGNSQVEKERFGSNPALMRGRRPPILFHKGELTEPGGTELSAAVREALGTTEQRVVGVVVNAIDDHLRGPDQVRPEWTLEYLSPQIKGLLDEAEAAGRIVIFTGDHGHVLDADSELRPSGYGDRWREAQGDPAPGELVVSGGRLDPGYGTKVIAPWSERIRYGPRKNGYHGGLSPQEIVVPVCVMARLGTKLEGWGDSWPTSPSWWDDAQPAPAQASLFAGLQRQEKAAELEWMGRLFKTATFKAQRQMAGAGAARDSEVRQLLEILATRGGRMSASALAQRLGLPPGRVTGRIAAIRRLLNVEGYQVLAYDYDSQMVELDLDLLQKQFEV